MVGTPLSLKTKLSPLLLHVCTLDGAHSEVGGELAGVGSLLPPHGFWGSKEGPRTWWQSPLASEPSPLPSLSYLCVNHCPQHIPKNNGPSCMLFAHWRPPLCTEAGVGVGEQQKPQGGDNRRPWRVSLRVLPKEPRVLGSIGCHRSPVSTCPASLSPDIRKHIYGNLRRVCPTGRKAIPCTRFGGTHLYT